MAPILQIFVVGLAVLVAAIIANVIVSSLGLMTWFTYMAAIKAEGFLTASKNAGFFSLLFLYVLYPLLLGYVPWKVIELMK